ncbi:Fetuin B [Scophthalmus maximus]|uniref:Fetuin B n=1 Tax=Scophthalmus maximus TaxID=52904 RepID=A0A2U9C388_SCOMX|nr:Fetuin B [Scophthalmus maximus]
MYSFAYVFTMKHRVLLSLLLALGCAHVRGAPVEQAGLEQGSCDDTSAKAAAGLALTKINQDRKEGYVFSLHRLSNVHTAKNGDNGVVFYLTLDVVETNCSVLNRGDKKTCEARPTHDTPVYGQCKTAIYISRVNRVVRLYKYDCVIRPDNGVVFYLTLDVVETNCSVLNRGDKKTCEARPTHDTPVYGQCKTAIYISRVNRVVRLYKYDCVIRPVPSARLVELCPDCPTLIGHDDVEVQKTVAASLEKFNKESGLAKRFALLNVTRATASMGMSTFYNVEYTVQETTCANGAKEATAEKCPLLDCEFTHKGFCKASHVHPPVGDAMTDVECDIYEPEGKVTMLPTVDQPTTLPFFPEVPEVAVTLPAKLDPEIPGEMEPTIRAFPTSVSAQCTAAPVVEPTLVDKLFAEDPRFKGTA